MIEEDTLDTFEVQSRWEAKAGPGCELLVTLGSGRELFVIRSQLDDVDAEVAAWQERMGATVAKDRVVAEWPLGTGGKQTTLDVTLEDGFRFEADLIEAPERVDTPVEDLETEWTFEGTPGVEMGERP